jgi:hypothetical protein
MIPSRLSLTKKIADTLITERLREAERIRRSKGEASGGARSIGREPVNAPAEAIRPELVDRLMELYCDWRTRCAEVQAAYEQFCETSALERAVAFEAYTAALDREESACASYAAQIQMIQSCFAVAEAHGAGTDSREGV